MHRLFEISRTGLSSLALHPLRSAVTAACLLGLLVPYLAGLGISQGIGRDADESIRFGANLYVTGRRFGRHVPLPISAVETIQHLDGVVEAVPRIVGQVFLGKDHESAVLVGMPAAKIPATAKCVRGRLHHGSRANELVVGTELARRLHLDVGSRIPPFYHSSQGDRVSEVVGIFASDVAIWQSRLIFTSLETAAAIFDEPGLASDVLVYCRPGYEERVRAAVLRIDGWQGASGNVRPAVMGRADLEAALPQGILHREGIFNLFYAVGFGLAVCAVLVVSGAGLAERRREIGILKATGWQTDEILLRGLTESALLSAGAASLAFLLAYVWLKWLNGYWIAGVLLANVDAAPSFQVPFRLTPVPLLLAAALSFAVIMTGTLYSTWRAASAMPREAMR